MKTIQINGLFFPFNGETYIDVNRQYDNTNLRITSIKLNISSNSLDLQAGCTYNFDETIQEVANKVYLCILNILQDFFMSENSFLELPFEIFEDYKKDKKLTKEISIENIFDNKYSSKDLNWRDSFKGLRLNKITSALNSDICKETWEEILEEFNLDKNKESLTPQECGEIVKFYNAKYSTDN